MMNSLSVKRVSDITIPKLFQNTFPTHTKRQQKLLLFFCNSLLAFLCLTLSMTVLNMNIDSSEDDTLFPCGKCLSPVTYDHKGLQCDTCNKWFHAPCQRVGESLYDYLSNSSCSWHCTKCNSTNYTVGSSQGLNSFTSENWYSILDSSTDNFIPASTSTPSKKVYAHDFKSQQSPENCSHKLPVNSGEEAPVFQLC